ncbi:MAG: tetratricopeptide repeat protein [Acidobacteria bacterium]|nr:tetratricopeptide repeat protein [Acidobacteriota bacterium]
MPRRLLLLALGVLVALPVHAAAQNREHQQIFADLRMLHEQTQLLRVAVAELAESLKGLNSRVDEQANLTRKLFADQGVQIGSLTENTRILREKLDATNVSISKDAHEMETIHQELAAQRTLLTQIIALLTPAALPGDPANPTAAVTGGTGGEPPTGATAPPPATVQLPPPPQNPQRAFDTAFGDYATGQYDMAIAGFQYYIESFPTSPDVPKARFHVAESHYGKGAYKEAVAAYEQVITLHKSTDWEPQALYKQGLAYEQLGQTERAKANWELVRKSFPDTSAAMLATQNLARIIKGGIF